MSATSEPSGDVPREPLADLRDVAAWSAVASGQARLALDAEAGPAGRPALRLAFDFQGGGGFVVARRPLVRAMPSAWALSLQVRGAAPANRLEVKLVDAGGSNVWWWRREHFAFPAEWQALRIRSRDMAFAWGPAGGAPLRELGAIEIAIVAGPGGQGEVSLCDLALEDLSLQVEPVVTASSTAPGHAGRHVLDAASAGTWRPADDDPAPWLALDFGGEHEWGALAIEWAGAGAPRAFDVQCRGGDTPWTTVARATQAEGAHSDIPVPGGASARHLRLALHRSAGDASPPEIRRLDVRPFDVARSLPEFFHDLAARAPRGHHPRWLQREQSYWTPVGVPGGTTSAIMNEEGLLEPERGSFSLEPFLHTEGRLVTWADARIAVSLADGELPIPTCAWQCGELTLSVTPCAVMASGVAQALTRYRVANEGGAPRSVRLFVALRPFQVSPPWQSYRSIGGIGPIHAIEWRDGAVLVDGAIQIIARTAPDAFGAAAFEQGEVIRHLAAGRTPPHARCEDASGCASAALCWEFTLAPGAAREVELAVPFIERPPLGAVTAAEGRAPPASLDEALHHWSDKLHRVHLQAGGNGGDGEDGARCLRALRTATGHILACRDGPALQPGPRRYLRAWIRDGATMCAALLRMGCADEARDFIAWYATHVASDGNVPCIVDRDGADWLPEHDSHGQFVATLAEVVRFTGDRDLAEALWPTARRAIAHLESLLAQRRTPEFLAPARRACFGILPESVSHEGYLAHAVHAYWDDFWAVRGIGDGAALAAHRGDEAEAGRLRALRDELERHLLASIASVIATRGIDYIPASVEWADPDPSATATALAITDAARRLPQAPLAKTFDEHLRQVRARRRGDAAWINYSAYEIRIVGALVRLGRREDAHELLDFFLADRRPTAWNQWPEISWRDPRSPGHLGDVPHAWIAAEYVLAVLALFAYERPDDGALVLAAGVSEAWLDAGGVVVEGLPTRWGALGYTLCRQDDDALRLTLRPGLVRPPGGIVVRAPLRRAPVRVEVDGRALSAWEAAGPTLAEPFGCVVFRF